LLTAIYALHGTDKIIRYIGKSVNPKSRFNSHKSTAKLQKYNKDNWINELCKTDSLQMTVLEWTENWQDAEKRWIEKGRTENWPLFNILDGGDDYAQLHTKTASQNRKNSVFRKIIVEMNNIERIGRNLVPETVSKNILDGIKKLRKTYADIKRKAGLKAAESWAVEMKKHFTVLS